MKGLLRTLREDAGLSALVGNKVFPLFIPTGNYLPTSHSSASADARKYAVRAFRAGGNRPSDRRLGTDYYESKDVAKAVRAAMPPSGPWFSAHLIEDQDLYEDGTNYFRVNMEFKVWFLEIE
ncbi:MAG: hypothetical protein ACLR7Z_08485 [Bilophila wadsworthia]